MTTVPPKTADPCGSEGIMGAVKRYGSEMFTLPELAREIGVQRQALLQRFASAEARNWKAPRTGSGLPKPDAHTHDGRPLWRKSTLVRAGVIDGAKQQDGGQ